MKKTLVLLISVLSFSSAKAQYSAIRVNILALATTTINVGVDVMVSPKWSVDVAFNYNPLTKFNVVALSIGARRWRFEPHVGAFWGIHSTTASYDIGNKTKYYKGWLTGVGGSYGYSWLLSKRWNFTLEGGIGIFYMKETLKSRYTPPLEDIYIYHFRRVVVAPSKLEISFSYLF